MEVNFGLSTTVRFAKIRESAIIPSKRDEDAGFDIYPNFQTDYILIRPNETYMIPTGICSAFGSNFVFICKERSSSGSKGMGQRAGVIDSGYRGEWLIPITNHTTRYIMICRKDDKGSLEIADRNGFVVYPYEKAICQAILVPIPEVKVIETPLDELKKIKSERGEGKLGSSGK